MITLFSAPKPFLGHVGTIQRNALASWRALGEEVEVLLVGDEPGVAEAAVEFGARHLPLVARNEHGTPLLSSIFGQVQETARFPVLGYVNADIILLEDLLEAVRLVRSRFPRFLLIARRWDLEVRERLRIDATWPTSLRERIAADAELHPPTGSDVFVFPRGTFMRIPDFAVGRAGWDNWMIFAGRRAHIPVVDATGAVTVVHQLHDYGHLPGGQPHYRLPESRRNVEMVGGRAAVFTVQDATWCLGPNGLTKRPWYAPGLLRALEAEIYAILGLPGLIRSARLVLHPVETVRYYWTAIGRRLRRFLGRRTSARVRR